jgi:hypothetical protein
MRTAERLIYIARDGREFRTAALCLAHERETCGTHLVGLTAKQVQAARTGADPELAEAFRIFASMLRKAGPKRLAQPNGNNAGDKAGSPLAPEAEIGAAADSVAGTDSERPPEAGHA